MLTIEPSRRITISEIIGHRWMTMAGLDPEFDRLIHESMRPGAAMSHDTLEPLNELVLKHMDRLEIDRKETLKVRCVVCDGHTDELCKMAGPIEIPVGI